MRTAKEMEEYASKYDSSVIKMNYLKHFSLIEKQLQSDENVKIALMCTGVYDGERIVIGGNVALAFTNKRLIYAQKGGALFGEQIKIINLDQVNDIQKQPFGLTFGTIYVDTIKENVGFRVFKKNIDSIFANITEIIDDYKTTSSNNTIVQQVSGADELKKFKELLDAGIISNEEFEAKKKQILGL